MYCPDTVALNPTNSLGKVGGTKLSQSPFRPGYPSSSHGNRPTRGWRYKFAMDLAVWR